MICLAAIAGSLTAAGQQIDLGGARAGRQHVALLTDSLDVKTGAPRVVELRFKVDAGFHINSHTPKDELLIPTAVTLQGDSLRVNEISYPQGRAFRLEIGDGETLDVYEGEFRVKLRLEAPTGASTLTGALRYQACDRAACFPPRTLPFTIAVTAR